jgi:hypothetical protein
MRTKKGGGAGERAAARAKTRARAENYLFHVSFANRDILLISFTGTPE